MTIEEVSIGGVIGGVFAIIGTYLGWLLQRRETRSQREERERRLRSLLAREIASDVEEILVTRLLEKDVKPEALAKLGPTKILVSERAYKSLLSDLTFLDERTMDSVLLAYDNFKSLNLRVKRWAVEPRDWVKEVLYKSWSDARKRVEEAGHTALRALGATSEIDRLNNAREEFEKMTADPSKQVQA